MGLCIGLSIVTVIEVVWLLIRIGANLLKPATNPKKMYPSSSVALQS
jgi:hypothetical protein